MIPGQATAELHALTGSTIPVSEVFGPTLQGEGPHTGRRCFFVRTGHCNLHCSWCDTPYTWDRRRYDVDEECPPRPIAWIHQTLRTLGALPSDVVVLSGGEPLIQHPRLPGLMGSTPYRWHVESNGTIAPPRWWGDLVDHTTLSPKVGQDDDPERRRLPHRSLSRWAELSAGGGVAWKFVVRRSWDAGGGRGGASPHQPDLDQVDELVAELGIDPGQVWLMPEGTDALRVLDGQRALAPAVIERGYNLTTRLHTLLWNDERGH